MLIRSIGNHGALLLGQLLKRRGEIRFRLGKNEWCRQIRGEFTWPVAALQRCLEESGSCGVAASPIRGGHRGADIAIFARAFAVTSK